MKKTFYRFSAAVLLLIFLLASGPIQPSAAQATQPLLYIYSYSPGPNTAVSPWSPFDFTFVISNNSPAAARNVVMTFSSEDFVPLDGGVFTLNGIGLEDLPGTTLRFRVSDYSSWKYSGVINATPSCFTSPLPSRPRPARPKPLPQALPPSRSWLSPATARMWIPCSPAQLLS